MQHNRYDGGSNDLLTAALGASELAGAAPSCIDPLNPTAGDLRTWAIYNTFRALIDTSAGGGYGTMFEPQVDTQSDNRRIADDEYLALLTVGENGTVLVTAMVQIPASFDTANACMVTAPSSGLRCDWHRPEN